VNKDGSCLQEPSLLCFYVIAVVQPQATQLLSHKNYEAPAALRSQREVRLQYQIFPDIISHRLPEHAAICVGFVWRASVCRTVPG
jgi:hypothetical protein